eukprot:CAMPEP_0182918562 /NCGR_PEP_ID=MMETSP0105_2-20130417/2163_1 /TAXON_ID=81532 ORGANISM="Acanthoeca-like sp., Strain 10tr" /NCGR_SAMPLE_ID=MMETSP0105_2 /ASSEMBLY_ACC=CAM_ASM_000205 /LENGTH=233 /DNA_ID=CAMNT_0025055659 /DNA_START=1313 /DNA_END=2015 /DNA_ORIENTATION=+
MATKCTVDCALHLSDQQSEEKEDTFTRARACVTSHTTHTKPTSVDTIDAKGIGGVKPPHLPQPLRAALGLEGGEAGAGSLPPGGSTQNDEVMNAPYADIPAEYPLMVRLRPSPVRSGGRGAGDVRREYREAVRQGDPCGARTVPTSFVLGGGRDGREIECLGAAYREGLEEADVGGVRFVFNDGKMKESRSWGVVRVSTQMATHPRPLSKTKLGALGPTGSTSTGLAGRDFGQ